jgi:hypothetical protein
METQRTSASASRREEVLSSACQPRRPQVAKNPSYASTHRTAQLDPIFETGIIIGEALDGRPTSSSSSDSGASTDARPEPNAARGVLFTATGTSSLRDTSESDGQQNASHATHRRDRWSKAMLTSKTMVGSRRSARIWRAFYTDSVLRLRTSCTLVAFLPRPAFAWAP